MRSIHDEYDRLLEGPAEAEADLADNLLAAHGIQTFRQASDMSREHFHGFQVPSRYDLYVPKGQRARANAILVEAWGSVSRDAKRAANAPSSVPRVLTGPRVLALFAVLLVVIVLARLASDGG